MRSWTHILSILSMFIGFYCGGGIGYLFVVRSYIRTFLPCSLFGDLHMTSLEEWTLICRDNMGSFSHFALQLHVQGLPSSISSDDDDIIRLILSDNSFRLFFERLSSVSRNLTSFPVWMLNNLFSLRSTIDKYGSSDITEKLKLISLFPLRSRVTILGRDLKVSAAMMWMLLDSKSRSSKLCSPTKLLFDNSLILLFETSNSRSLYNDKNMLPSNFVNLFSLMFKDRKFLSVDKPLGWMSLILFCPRSKDFNMVNGSKVSWPMLLKLLDLRFNCES